MMFSDIDIAQGARMKPIMQVAASIDVYEEELELYGKYKAKLADCLEERLKSKQDGRLIFVTAINPTPTGDIMTMPGLPKSPAAKKIDIMPNGEITGLF